MSHYKLQERYQFQSLPVRLYRRVRHGLPILPMMLKAYAEWIFVHRLAIPEYPHGYYRSRLHVFTHSLTLWLRVWEMNCGSYVTMDEVKAGFSRAVHGEPD